MSPNLPGKFISASTALRSLARGVKGEHDASLRRHHRQHVDQRWGVPCLVILVPPDAGLAVARDTRVLVIGPANAILAVLTAVEQGDHQSVANPTAGSSVVNQGRIQHSDGNRPWAIYLDSCTKSQRGLAEHCPKLRHGVGYLSG